MIIVLVVLTGVRDLSVPIFVILQINQTRGEELMNYIEPAKRSEAGFTLVELAVVMIIIGLLIGGVLKGQELIANAQITSTVAQIKGIDAATTTFRDMYDALPGDMARAGARLPACAGACVVAAGPLLGNRRVDSAFTGAPGAEGTAFWLQLNAADLLTGINPANGNVWGGNFPEAEIGGGFHVGFFPGVGNLASQVGAVGNPRAGHYLALHATPAGAVAATGFLNPNQAFRIDSKLDDGVPGTGSVLAAGAATCVAAAVYNEAVPAASCNVYTRFQN
jgi:prepilin-type N-terminal cleavage/methylation domain-containing protein